MKNNLLLDQKRVAYGFTLTPIISCFIAALIWATYDTIHDRRLNDLNLGNIDHLIDSIGTTFLLLIIVAYFVSYFLGIPSFYILKKMNLLNIYSILISAYVISLIGFISLGILISPDKTEFIFSLNDVLTFLFYPAHLITVMGGLIFWWIAIRPSAHQQ
jgi:hypothetical protein